MRPEAILTNSLSSSRFMKSIVARHKFGPLVLKIFIKPDSSMSLRVIQRRLKSVFVRMAEVLTYRRTRCTRELDQRAPLLHVH